MRFALHTPSNGRCSTIDVSFVLDGFKASFFASSSLFTFLLQNGKGGYSIIIHGRQDTHAGSTENGSLRTCCISTHYLAFRAALKASRIDYRVSLPRPSAPFVVHSESSCQIIPQCDGMITHVSCTNRTPLHPPQVYISIGLPHITVQTLISSITNN